MKKTVCGIFYFVVIFMFLCPVSWASSPSREKVITEKLNCVSQFSQQNKLNWADVCSVDEYRYSQLAQRNAAIDDAMNEASRPKVQAPIIKEEQAVTPKTEEPVIKTPPAVPVPSKTKATSTVSIPTRKVATQPSDKTIRHKKNTLELSVPVYYSEYYEPDVMNQEGGFYGVAAGYTYRPGPDDPFYFEHMFYGLQGEWARGSMDYSSSGSGTMNNKKNMMWDIRGILGGDLPLNPQLGTSAYTGFGYRYLIDESENRRTDLGYWGYDRHQSYAYLPLGLTFEMKTNAITSVEANFEYDYVFWGHNTSKTGYVAGYSDMEFEQNQGNGFRVSLKLKREMDKYSLFFQPFWRYWSIPQSDVSSGYVEPYNTTREVGLKVGVEF